MLAPDLQTGRSDLHNHYHAPHGSKCIASQAADRGSDTAVLMIPCLDSTSNIQCRATTYAVCWVYNLPTMQIKDPGIPKSCLHSAKAFQEPQGHSLNGYPIVGICIKTNLPIKGAAFPKLIKHILFLDSRYRI